MKAKRSSASWPTTTIGKSAYLRGRIGWQGLRASEFTEEGPYLVTGTDLIGGKVDWDRCYHLSEVRFKEAPSIHLKNDDVLITKDGTIGKLALVKDCPRQAILNSGIFLLRSKDGSFIHSYIFQLLHSLLFRKFLDDNLAGSTIQHLYQHVFEAFEFPTPEPLEQKKISDILGFLDLAIEQTSRLLEKECRIRNGLITDLLSRGIDKNGSLRTEDSHTFQDTELGRFPIDWQVAPLDRLAVRGSGHTPNKRKPEYWNGGVKWVSLADSDRLDQIWIENTDKEISPLGLKNSSAVLHPKGTVVLSRDAGVGKSAILVDDMAVSQHFMAWRCNPDRLNNMYLYYWLQRDKPKFEGIALGSTILTIGLQFFKQYKIAIPIDIDEQKKIADALLLADEAVSGAREQLAKLRLLKEGLMQDLLSGKKRVTALLDQELRR